MGIGRCTSDRPRRLPAPQDLHLPALGMPPRLPRLAHAPARRHIRPRRMRSSTSPAAAARPAAGPPPPLPPPHHPRPPCPRRRASLQGRRGLAYAVPDGPPSSAARRRQGALLGGHCALPACPRPRRRAPAQRHSSERQPAGRCVVEGALPRSPQRTRGAAAAALAFRAAHGLRQEWRLRPHCANALPHSMQAAGPSPSPLRRASIRLQDWQVRPRGGLLRKRHPEARRRAHHPRAPPPRAAFLALMRAAARVRFSGSAMRSRLLSRLPRALPAARHASEQ